MILDKERTAYPLVQHRDITPPLKHSSEIKTSESPLEVSKGTPDISWGGYLGTPGWMLDI